MTIRRALSIAAILLSVALLGLGWHWLGDPTPPRPTPPAASAADSVADAASGAAGPAPNHATMAAAPPAEASGDAGRVAAPPPQARIVGRCVDERHQPLADCGVRLDVAVRGGQPPIEPLAVATDAAGAFTLAVPIDPAWSYTLRAETAGRVGRLAAWPSIAVGEQIDVGTFVLPPGILVRGRVVDTNGAPVTDTYLEVRHGRPDQPADYGPGLLRVQGTRTGADGMFATTAALPAGPFTIRPHGDRQPIAPVTGELRPERPVEFVTIIVPALDPSEWITGTVVDARGNPVHPATVDAGELGHMAMTSRDGKFRLRRRAGVDPGLPIHFKVWNDEHGDLSRQPAVTWGSTGVELRLAEGNSLELRVRDQAGRPVQDFQVTLGADKNPPPTAPAFAGKRKAGPFVDGIATLRAVQLGRCRALIEYGPAATHPPRLLTLDLTAQHTRIDVLAEPIVARTIEVVDGSGQPVAGALVQLCDPVDGEFLPTTAVAEGQQILIPFGSLALQVQVAHTDAFGRAVLRGPGTRELAVRLPGPGHQPTQRQGVSLAEPAPLRIEVSVGAHLVGKIGPLDAVEFLRGLAGDAAAQLRNPLQLQFQRPIYDPAAAPLPAVPLAADGSFDQRGLLPGAYLVSLQHPQPGSELLGEVTLVDGQTTRFQATIPVELMTPGTLTGRVLKNGQPAAEVFVTLHGTCGAVNGRSRTETLTTRTDAAGRFRASLRPGSYRATAQCNLLGEARAMLQAAETALVQSRTDTEQDFTLATGTLQVTLRNASGAAMPAVTIFDTAAEMMRIVMLPPTAADGSTSLELDAGTMALRTLPKRLQSTTARNELLVAGGWGAFDSLWIPLGTAEVRVGAITSVELRLPADWDR